MYVYDSNGTVVELGDVINAGGEGEVRAVVGDGATAAKLYREPTPERRAKIQNMVALYDKIMACRPACFAPCAGRARRSMPIPKRRSSSAF